MRQAVPLLKPESPIVGTGLERQVASDSRVLINARRRWSYRVMLIHKKSPLKIRPYRRTKIGLASKKIPRLMNWSSLEKQPGYQY